MTKTTKKRNGGFAVDAVLYAQDDVECGTPLETERIAWNTCREAADVCGEGRALWWGEPEGPSAVQQSGVVSLGSVDVPLWAVIVGPLVLLIVLAIAGVCVARRVRGRRKEDGSTELAPGGAAPSYGAPQPAGDTNSLYGY
jgi:hypothetical protein